MPEGLKIQVGADVQGAVQGAKRVSDALDIISIGTKKTGLAFDSLKDKVQAFGGGVGRFIPPVVANFSKIPPAVDKASKSLTKLASTSSNATQASVNLGRVIQDAPFGFLGIANNLNPLLESFQRLRATTGSNMAAFKALGSSLMGAGGLGLAVSLVSTGLILFGDKLFGAGRAAKKTQEATDALQDSIKGVFKEIAKEATEVGSLVVILKSEEETRARKLSAIKELQKIQPEIFAGLKLEGQAVVGLDTAYKAYLANLKNVIAAKILQAKIEQKISDILVKQGLGSDINVKKLQESIRAIQLGTAPTDSKAGLKSFFDNQDRIANEGIASLEKQIAGFFEELGKISKAIKVPGLNIKTDGTKIKIDGDSIEDAIAESLTAGFRNAKIPQTIFIPATFGITFKVPKAKFDITGGSLGGTEIGDLTAAEKLLAKVGEDVAKAFNDGLQSGISNGLAGFGQGLGEALTGGGIGDAFKAFAASIGDALQAMGKQIIGIGIAAVLAKEALKTLFANPVTAILAGTALVAAGAALKNVLSGGVRGFAAGGLVYGPTLGMVGEGSGTSRSNPEVIAPLDQLRSMLGDMGGGRQHVYITGRLRGNDMVLQNARTSRSQRRTTGR